ncbi:Fusaric acid resistance protein family protein [compost metagenome]
MAGLIWIETAWDGARAGMILVGILCSLMATFPRPLLASQNYVRGLGLALVVSAIYQFMLVPAIGDFEMLALILVPLLYVIAVGLASPATAGIGMGLGLSTFLMVGPQNIGAWQNTAAQWFEFTGAYVCAGVLSLLVYSWVFPFNPVECINYLFRESREQVYLLLKTSAADEQQFAFESRMVDRLTMMLGLLPAANDLRSNQLYEVSLACMALGVALNQLKQQSQDNVLLSPQIKERLQSILRQTGRYVADRPGVDFDELTDELRLLGEELDQLHSSELASGHEYLWSVFRIRVALLIVASFIERYCEFLQPSDAGVPILAH